MVDEGDPSASRIISSRSRRLLCKNLKDLSRFGAISQGVADLLCPQVPGFPQSFCELSRLHASCNCLA